MDQKNNKPNRPPQDGSKKPKNLLITLIITLGVVLLISSIYNIVSTSQYTETSYSDFRAAMDAGNLSEVELQADRIIYMTKEEANKPASQQKACYTGLPSYADTLTLMEELYDMDELLHFAHV